MEMMPSLVRGRGCDTTNLPLPAAAANHDEEEEEEKHKTVVNLSPFLYPLLLPWTS